MKEEKERYVQNTQSKLGLGVCSNATIYVNSYRHLNQNEDKYIRFESLYIDIFTNRNIFLNCHRI